MLEGKKYAYGNADGSLWYKDATATTTIEELDIMAKVDDGLYQLSGTKCRDMKKVLGDI